MNRKHLLIGLTLTALLTGGCGQDEIRQYSTPKNAPKAVQELAEESMEARVAEKVEKTQKPEMLWDLPQGWTREAGKKSMRVATLLVGEGEEKVEVVVSQLPSPVGTLMGNVNRWRGQVGAKALNEEEFTALARDKESGFVSALGIRPDPRLQGYLFDIRGETGAEGAEAKRMLVALMVDGFERTWFIKTTNTSERLQGRLDDFRKLVSSFRLDGEVPMMDTAPVDAPMTWKTPEGWTEGPAGSGMITVAFTVGEGDSEVRTTIMALGGDGGGVLPNVNRWRNQVGLDPLSKLADQESRTLKVDGNDTVIYDLIAPEGDDATRMRIVVGMLVTPARTWYFKMMGASALVGDNIKSFDALLESVSFSKEKN